MGGSTTGANVAAIAASRLKKQMYGCPGTATRPIFSQCGLLAPIKLISVRGGGHVSERLQAQVDNRVRRRPQDGCW